jgi:hypothetical protein
MARAFTAVCVRDSILFSFAILIPATLLAQPDTCKLNTVVSPVVDAWSLKVITGLVGGDYCYAAPDAFHNSDCNIFVGRSLEVVYGLEEFVTGTGANRRYFTSNEIHDLLAAGTISGWHELGRIRDLAARQEAKRQADLNHPVVAVWRDPTGPTGHIALVGPGPMTTTGSLGPAPVSASFFQGHPNKNYIGKPLSCAFQPAQFDGVRIFARTGEP